MLDFKDLLPIGMLIVVLVIGLSIGLQVTEETQADMTSGSAAYNATGEGITALAKIPAKLPIVVTVLMAVIILGLLIRNLAFR